MAIFRLTKDALIPLVETRLSEEGVFERGDLQRLLRSHIQALDPDLLVISEEFGDWVDSSRRVDLLCLDRDANLVVVELKRTEDGGHMELQAIRYAAMISPMTFVQLVDAHKQHLLKVNQPPEQAEQNILNFLDWNQPDDEQFASNVRIVLAGADFSKEITTSVLWLNDQGLDIRCVRLKPYRDTDGNVLLDVQQLIPLPEAAAFQTQIRAKGQAGRAERAERYDLRLRFWTQLLAFARDKTDLHANRSPGIHNWIGGSIGRRGFHLNYVLRDDESQVELYIDMGADSAQANLKAFNQLLASKPQIEAAFQDSLEWQELPDRRACRIRKVIPGGYRSPEAEWPRIQAQLVDSMVRLDKAFRPYVQQIA